jgi:hypothetical protein
MISTIYQIYCKDKNITEVYVGSTENFQQRCRKHNTSCHNENSVNHNYKVYKFIRANGGMENWNIEPIIESEEDTRYDAEVHYFKIYNSKLNSRFPRRNRKEYYLDNIEQIKERKCKKNQCECGGRYTYNNKSSHLKSKIHKLYLEQIE